MHPATLLSLAVLPLLSSAVPIDDPCDNNCKGTIGAKLDQVAANIPPGTITCATEMKHNFGDSYDANGLLLGPQRNFVVLGGAGLELNYDEKLINSLFACEVTGLKFTSATSATVTAPAPKNATAQAGKQERAAAPGQAAVWVISGVAHGKDEAARKSCVADAVNSGLRQAGDADAAVKCTDIQG